MIHFILYWGSMIVPLIIVILGCLTLLSLVITWIYVLEKRIIGNIWGQKIIMEFIYSKYTKKRETKTLNMKENSKENEE